MRADLHAAIETSRMSERVSISSNEDMRNVPLEARTFVDEMTTAQMELTAQIVTLAWVTHAIPEHPVTQGVGTYIREAGKSFTRLRSALSALRLDARGVRLGALLAPDANLADYLRGLYAWSAALVRALEDLALEARVRAPRWGKLQRRIEDARVFHLDDLESAVRKQWAQMRRATGCPDSRRNAVASIGQHLDDLFWAASQLASRIEPPAHGFVIATGGRERTGAPSERTSRPIVMGGQYMLVLRRAPTYAK